MNQRVIVSVAACNQAQAQAVQNIVESLEGQMPDTWPKYSHKPFLVELDADCYKAFWLAASHHKVEVKAIRYPDLWVTSYRLHDAVGGAHLIRAASRSEANKVLREWYALKHQESLTWVKSIPVEECCENMGVDLCEFVSTAEPLQPGEITQLWSGH